MKTTILLTIVMAVSAMAQSIAGDVKVTATKTEEAKPAKNTPIPMDAKSIADLVALEHDQKDATEKVQAVYKLVMDSFTQQSNAVVMAACETAKIPVKECSLDPKAYTVTWKPAEKPTAPPASPK
jgi:hypothetical protein